MKRQCAVCSDKCQTNVKLKWRRESDHKVFHICMTCAETNKVNEHSVKEVITKTYTTIEERNN